MQIVSCISFVCMRAEQAFDICLHLHRRNLHRSPKEKKTIIPQYKLPYFNMRGRAAPTRLIFKAAGVERGVISRLRRIENVRVWQNDSRLIVICLHRKIASSWRIIRSCKSGRHLKFGPVFFFKGLFILNLSGVTFVLFETNGAHAQCLTVNSVFHLQLVKSFRKAFNFRS